MPGMPMPQWYEDAKKDISVVAEKTADRVSIKPVEFEKLDDYQNLFAEFGVREGDVILHLFPRDGADDQWVEGHYVNLCRSCKKGVPAPRSVSKLSPCPACGHTGLVYVPGRVEEKAEAAFPVNMRDLIKEAMDRVWMGDVAVEEVPELGAYAVQMQSARNTLKLVGPFKFVGRICEIIDELLERKH